MGDLGTSLSPPLNTLTKHIHIPTCVLAQGPTSNDCICICICIQVRLNKLESFRGLVDHFTQEVDEWKQWQDEPEPHLAAFPGEWQEKLNGFKKLVLIRCLRPEKVYTSNIPSNPKG